MRSLESKFKVAQNDAEVLDSRMEKLDDYNTECLQIMERRMENVESLYQDIDNEGSDTVVEANDGEVDIEDNGSVAERSSDADEEQDNAADGKVVEQEGIASESPGDQDEAEENANGAEDEEEDVASDAQGDQDQVEEDATGAEDKEADNAADANVHEAEEVATNDEDDE